VRELVAYAFGLLVRLLPLDEGLPMPKDMPCELVERKLEEKRFLQQFLDGKKTRELRNSVQTEWFLFQHIQ